MSFATVLGGTTTLIGTSTNLVVSGLQEAKYGTTVSALVSIRTDRGPGVTLSGWMKMRGAAGRERPCLGLGLAE
jgi:hypothetical protein